MTPWRQLATFGAAFGLLVFGVALAMLVACYEAACKEGLCSYVAKMGESGVGVCSQELPSP